MTRPVRTIYSAESPIVIGVGGLKTSGKDALAIALEAVGFRRRGMSDPLLEWTLIENPWIRIEETDPSDLVAALIAEGLVWRWFIRAKALIEAVGYDEAKRIREFRVYLQRIGGDAGRTVIGEDVWADVAAERIMQDLAFGRDVVITGIRYENEMSMLHDLGGTAVWIDRPEVTAAHVAALAQQDATAEHSSEVSLSAKDFDIVIPNDGPLPELTIRAQALVARLRSRHPSVRQYKIREDNA